jgi:hypothetical protein
VASQKTLVIKVVGIGKIHSPAKIGIKIQKFIIELAQI